MNTVGVGILNCMLFVHMIFNFQWEVWLPDLLSQIYAITEECPKFAVLWFFPALILLEVRI
jgi:hypothetical protein